MSQDVPVWQQTKNGRNALTKVRSIERKIAISFSASLLLIPIPTRYNMVHLGAHVKVDVRDACRRSCQGVEVATATVSIDGRRDQQCK